jgi:hypothetical protein
MRVDFLFRELTPKSWNKHIIVYSGAVVGAVAFVMTISWASAIFWDLATVFCIWAILKLCRAI